MKKNFRVNIMLLVSLPLVMINTLTYYIAIGTNRGDKLQNIENAIKLMNGTIGLVESISKIYKSPAFGFDSDDFFNCCLILKSQLQPQILLDKLLAIEIKMGRTRTNPNIYEARIIDLDIVFADDLIINTSSLELPHPEMQHRRFVLLPLNDLCPNKRHPKLKKEVAVLLANCIDDSVLEDLDVQLTLN